MLGEDQSMITAEQLLGCLTSHSTSPIQTEILVSKSKFKVGEAASLAITAEFKNESR